MWLVSLTFEASPLAEVEMLYYQGCYEEVLERAEGLLAEDSLVDRTTQVELRKYIAYSYVALGRTSDAKAEFKAILAADSSLVLEPQLVSPKIIEVFDEAKEEMRVTGYRPDSTASLGSGNLGLTLSLRTATLRSFTFPGLGQFYSGERVKGWLFAAGEGLCLGGFIVSQVFTVKTHRDYMEVTDPAEMEVRYRVYNNWYRTRNALAGLSVGIWISAPLDILIFPPPWAKGR